MLYSRVMVVITGFREVVLDRLLISLLEYHHSTLNLTQFVCEVTYFIPFIYGAFVTASAKSLKKNC